MSVIAPIKNNDFVASIVNGSERISGFDQLRAHGNQGLETTAFPTLKNEVWKYTRVSGLLRKSFQVNPNSEAHISEATLALIGDNARLVFVNGYLNTDLSTTFNETGLTVRTLKQAQVSENELTNFPTSWENEQEAFTLLNESSFTDGTLIEVAKNTKLDTPVFMVHISTGENTATAQRNYVRINEGAEATFIHLFEGGNELNLSTPFSSVLVGENAHFNWFQYHQEGEQANVIATTIVHQQANSHVNFGAYVFGGKLIRNNLYLTVLGQNCETTANGTYILKGKQVADFRVIVDHKAAHCESNQTFKGVMSDKATGIFNGKIYVRRDSQIINAFQTNRNILLSDDANAYSRPQLEVYADDVKCSHGSTIGQLDDQALFYMMARGIRRKEAEKLLVSAFVADAVENVNFEPLHDLILESVADKSATL